MGLQELLSHFAVALGIGLLIGLERGWATREDAPGSRTAGIRTFAITGLLGGVIGAIAQASGGPASSGGGIIIGLGFAAYVAAITVFTREENLADKNFSATTAIAAMLTFALGVYAMVGDIRITAAAAVAAAGLLALRENIHGWVKNITWAELRSALVLLAMTFIALPVIPNDLIGPFGGVNPRDVWLTAIVLAGVSFLGYGAVKYLGARRGVLLAAAAGGLASSTAVAATNAKRAAAGEGEPRLLAAGVSLANAVSWMRVVAILAVLKPVLLVIAAPPLIAAALLAAGYAMLSVDWRGGAKSEEPAMTMRNPFGFWSVVGFAIVLVAIILLGRVLGQTFGATGVLAGTALLGLGDVDAVTVSMAKLDTVSAEVASYAVLIAVASNTMAKLAIGAVIGRGRFAIEVTAVSLACLLAGGAALYAARFIPWAAGLN